MADNDTQISVVRKSRDGKWALIIANNEKYFILHKGEDGNMEMAHTPAGNAIDTRYESLAYRLLHDIEIYGIDCFSPESIVPWHFTMIDNFMKMKHEEVEGILDQSFLRKNDWTLDGDIDDEKWLAIFGESETRKQEIREWLSKCTHMQMTAACCIGNAHHSLNIAYVVAQYMENYEGGQLDQQLRKLASRIGQYSMYAEAEDMMVDFETFKLYYGIHLETDGAIINKELLEETPEYIGKETSVEALVGRNFAHYTDGKIDSEQPLKLTVPDLTLVLDDELNDDEDGEDDEDDDEEYSELSDHLTPDCWIKRINAGIDGQEAYYILEVVVKNGVIKNVYVTLEEVEHMGHGMFMIPGMEMAGQTYYSELDYIPEECEDELDKLVSGRYLKEGFSFIGKMLPQKMIDEGGNGGSDTDYAYACQSAYRQAYMYMSITTSEDGEIEDFDYSTYQSSGSAWGDMFSRPQYYSDREDEAIDMLLYILDKYDEEDIN